MSDKNQTKVVVPKYVTALAASLGGLVEACALQPLDVAKTRLQLDKAGKYRGIMNCFTTIQKTEGTRALYKGLTPFVTHLTFKYALRLYSYEMYRDFLTNNGETKLTTGKQLFAGLMSGVTEAILIVTPFEVVKTRLQKQIGMDKALMKYKNPVHCAATIIREEGPSALLKGVVPTTVRQGSNQMLNFFSVGAFNEHVWGKKRGDGKQLALYQTVLSGSIGGALGPISNSPADVIKTRLQSQVTKPGQALKYTGFVNCFFTILREEGIQALYKGLSVRLARSAPGQAIMWTVIGRVTSTYEQMELAKLDKEETTASLGWSFLGQSGLRKETA